ncbi:autotransporter outer membrane beta-barrel domain-containing protein [Phascolarctobacterium faecium]|uniref:autotransporter outer membrane beta-barrel domain-containing protein n=1 Tax=Phascolarctobacterium faecium TaxID=33025 RepID=UPI00210DBDA8|nr:autotransporter outer membrane beta-barrel domain-containing protein [Phascolarctobacterium faecium]MCQ4907125.1 autotransporter outer membrane beta-barrel domain-containing protein [Phascolarctobacterium faecium]
MDKVNLGKGSQLLLQNNGTIKNQSTVKKLISDGGYISLHGEGKITGTDTERNRIVDSTVAIYDNGILEYTDFSGKSIINASQPSQGGSNQNINNITLNDSSELRTYGDADEVAISNISLYDDSQIHARRDANLKNVFLGDNAALYVYEDLIGLEDLELRNKSYVLLSNQITSMSIGGDFIANGGTVAWSSGNDYNTKTLTIDNLINDNNTTTNFILKTDLNSETIVESVVVNNAEQDSVITVGVRDKSKIDNYNVGDNKKVLVVVDNSQNLKVTGKEIDNGGIWSVTPTIENGSEVGGLNTEWYLTNIEKKENGNTETINDGFASDYSLWRATNDTLRKRLGDIRSGEHGTDGVWARMYHGKLKGQSYSDKYHTYQLGYDKTRYDEKNGQRTNGIVLERSEGKLSYTAGKGETGLTALGLYTTWFGNKGHYTDIVLRAGHLDHKMNTYGEYAERSDYDNAAYSISFEYGRQKNYEKGWFFTPQAQITLGRMNSVDFTTERGTKIDVDGLTSAIGRIGFEVGRKISPESSYYFKLGAFHEFDGDRDVSMVAANGENLLKRYDNGDTWYEFGMGAQVQLSRNTHFYGDIERSFGGDTKKEWQVNTGIRWEF